METPPSGSAAYPRGNQNFGGAPFRGPGVYFDYINTAFSMITKNAAVYVLGSFIILLMFYGMVFPLSFLSNYISYGSATGPRNLAPDQYLFSVARSMPVSLAVNLIPGTLFYMLFTGISLCAIEQADTGVTSINTVFKGFNNFGNTFVCCILMYFAMTIGFYFCCVPFFFLGGLFAFVPIISATEGLGVAACFSKSIDMLKPYILPMAGLYFVASLIGGLGVCLCGLGLFITFPILYVVIGLHYRDFRGPVSQITY